MHVNRDGVLKLLGTLYIKTRKKMKHEKIMRNLGLKNINLAYDIDSKKSKSF